MIKKNSSEEILTPLCHQCSIEHNDTRKCLHTVNRIIHTTITFTELSHCLKRGYKVKQVYESIVYRNSSNYMKPFWDVLSRFLLVLKKPNNMNDQSYCAQINEEMDYCSKLKISPSDLKQDEYLQKFLKFLFNSITGRIYKRSKGKTQLSVTQDKDYFISRHVANDIIGLDILDNETLAIFNKQKIHLNDATTNCIIAAYLTSYSRQLLDDLAQNILKKHNGKILYMDTGIFPSIYY